MHFRISYRAQNQYGHPVSDALWDLLILPAELPGQRLIGREWALSIAADIHLYPNSFGFETLRVRPLLSFEVLQMEARFQVSKQAPAFSSARELPGPAALACLRSAACQAEHGLFLVQTPYTLPPEAAEAPGFGGGQPVSAYVAQLSDWIYRHLRFEPGTTHVHTTAAETWALRSGVCQDYAHLMIGLLRSQQIPARYVSGYLHPGPGHQGSTAMHAWVEAWAPGAGWMGIDPANNLAEDIHFIKVAHGCDYQDCPPIKGLVYTAGGQQTEYSVSVVAQQNILADNQALDQA